jgi:hypothetical protein
LYLATPISMLALPVPRKESVMSEQLLLFDRKRSAWIERVWKTIDPKQRQETIAILSEMARDALTDGAGRREKERRDDA